MTQLSRAKNSNVRLPLLGTSLLLGILLLAVGCGGSGGTGKNAGGAKGGQKGQINMTFEEFKKNLYGDNFDPKSWSPRQKFYEQFGEPLRITDVGDSTYLYYQCKDATARIECGKGEFNYQDTIRPLSVDRQ
ncbi:MAG: hypothetical protein N2112_04700 [Gemmataceae bacterium]|jgi:hypothetical protein|nr:hypothetical protein [Gemmataceae bacterium]